MGSNPIGRALENLQKGLKGSVPFLIIIGILVFGVAGFYLRNYFSTPSVVTTNTDLVVKNLMNINAPGIIAQEGTTTVIGLSEINPNKKVEDNPACTVLELDLQYPIYNKNVEVTRLQRFLVQGGYFNLQPTGYFDTITRGAVKVFQQKTGISVTGIVNLETRKKIQELSCVSSGQEIYTGKIKFIAPSANQVLRRGQGIMITWSPGYIASPSESKDQLYDIHVIYVGDDSNYTLFKNVTRAGYYWQAGYKGFTNPNGYPDGRYKLQICLTVTNTCTTSSYTFSVSSATPGKIACQEIPCFYDGKFMAELLGALDYPPDKTSAAYPYQFNVPTQMYVKLIIKTWMGSPGGMTGDKVSNTLSIKVDDKEVFTATITTTLAGKYQENSQRNKTDEIDLGILSAGPHFIKVSTSESVNPHLSVDFFRILPMSPGEKYLN
mgnify:CR=1 FL=1